MCLGIPGEVMALLCDFVAHELRLRTGRRRPRAARPASIPGAQPDQIRECRTCPRRDRALIVACSEKAG